MVKVPFEELGRLGNAATVIGVPVGSSVIGSGGVTIISNDVKSPTKGFGAP